MSTEHIRGILVALGTDQETGMTRALVQCKVEQIQAVKHVRMLGEVAIIPVDKESFERLVEEMARSLDPLAFELMRGPGERGMELATVEARQLQLDHRKNYALRKAKKLAGIIGITP